MLRTSNLAGIFTGPIRRNPIIESPLKFWRKWSVGVSSDLSNLGGGVLPIISGTGKATDFKFGGYIYRANPNKSPLKILEKMQRGRIQGLSKFFGYPLLSQERVKLRTSNFVGTYIGSIGTSPWKMLRIVAVGVVSWVPKLFRAPMYLYRVHCAVIFAIAQLSCQFFYQIRRQSTWTSWHTARRRQFSRVGGVYNIGLLWCYSTRVVGRIRNQQQHIELQQSLWF